MGQAIGQILPLAVAVGLSPIPIVAVVLVLSSERARSNGPAFLIGWVAGIVAIGALVLLLVHPARATVDGEPATWVSVVQLAIGLLFLVLALRQWRERPRVGAETAPPKWMAGVARFSAPKACRAGVVLAAANPKNLLLAIAAADTIAGAGLSAREEAVAYGVFAVIATIGVAVPVAIFFVLGDRAGSLLEEIRNWFARNNAVIMVVLLLLIGAKLIGDGIAGLF